MRTLESGVTQPERGRREMGRQGKFSFGQPGVRSRLGANHGGHQVVQPKRIMVQRRAQPLAGDTVITGESMRASRSDNQNKTGLPDRLKAGIENLSGYSMDDVRVHYNSEKPAQLEALAYTQGTDIHVASGQEKHLAHEAWHVVQQKQGRVKPTSQWNGLEKVNVDAGLEKEADVKGREVLRKERRVPVPSSIIYRMFESKATPPREKQPMRQFYPEVTQKMPTESSGNPTTIQFNQTTNDLFKENFTNYSGGKETDKTFHILNHDKSTVWTVGKSGIKDEYNALKKLSDNGCNTVLKGDLVPCNINMRGQDPSQGFAYPMKWISNGLSSNSNQPDFLKALTRLNSNHNTLNSLEEFQKFAKKEAVQDFQAILDQSTGIIYANDPRGIMSANPKAPMVRTLDLWSQHINQTKPMEPMVGQDLSFMNIDWDKEFKRKAMEGKVWEISLKNVPKFMDQSLKESREKGENFPMQYQSQNWDIVHINETENLVYLGPVLENKKSESFGVLGIVRSLL
ncbi:MAG: DUF4157 domain-containing protein [Moorea sp. SIOASIH]|nr:DUF4157 domain-containing protein [Moorena sp. SIOASIH]